MRINRYFGEITLVVSLFLLRIKASKCTITKGINDSYECLRMIWRMI